MVTFTKNLQRHVACPPGRYGGDLVYRHGLDVDDTGDVPALGSTTGSLWISDDGGEPVTTVAAHLPPIACVRFA